MHPIAGFWGGAKHRLGSTREWSGGANIDRYSGGVCEMYCPQCNAEYRAGFYTCSDCDVPLVETLPPEPEHPEGPFTEVFESADASLLPVVESLLDGAGIPFLVQGGESAGGVFPLGSIGGGADERLLRAVIKVPEEHAEAAIALLVAADEVPDFTDPASDESE